MILEGLFEPTVMFFGLINLLVIFQTIMNEILQNLLNTGKVTSFTNNIIIEIEGEGGHGELVEEVVRRPVENDLYMKLEKCKWKSKGGRVSEGSNRTEENKDGERKGKRCSRLADPKESQRCTEVLEIGKLLLSIY